MKKLLVIIFFFAALGFDKKFYWTGGGEWIFSFVDGTDGAKDWGSVLRYSPVLNIQSFANYDFSAKAGFLVDWQLEM